MVTRKECLAEWADVLKSLRDCSTEFAKENLKESSV